MDLINNNNTAKKLALTGALSALVIILGVTNLGLIKIGPAASITILQIPVILASMLVGLPGGLFVGFVFGLVSLIQAAVSPSGALDPFFVNPLISVLPRMMVAVVSWAIYKLLTLIPKMPKSVSAGITGFLGSFLHTVFVMSSLYFIKAADIQNLFGVNGLFAIIGLVSFNAILESIVSTILCVAVFVALYVGKNKKSKLER